MLPRRSSRKPRNVASRSRLEACCGRDLPGRRHTIKASFLIACDGGRSTARDRLGLPFTGQTYPETTILATTSFPFHEHLPDLSNVNYCWYHGGTFSLLRLPKLWRVSLYPDDGETVEQAIQPDAIERKLQRIVPNPQRYPVGEVRPYRIHQRILSDYRVGRVLFAGDAAHLNSPSGGMGMNGGIHDAFCLTETLAPVWRAESPMSTLDRYTRRRQPVAREQILKRADQNRRRMQQRDPARRQQMLTELQAITADRQRLHTYLLGTSMIAGLRRAAQID